MYDVGDKAKVTGLFTSRALSRGELKIFQEEGVLPPGVGVDPGDVVCTVAVGDEISTPDVTRVDAGIYTALWTIASEEDVGYAFDGTGEFQASGEGILSVSKRRVPRA